MNSAMIRANDTVLFQGDAITNAFRMPDGDQRHRKSNGIAASSRFVLPPTPSYAPALSRRSLKKANRRARASANRSAAG